MEREWFEPYDLLFFGTGLALLLITLGRKFIRNDCGGSVTGHVAAHSGTTRSHRRRRIT
jgi:hypothetical protein